jgi:hypothetical protein
MRRRRTSAGLALAFAFVALVLALAACGGGETTTRAAPAGEAAGGSGAPPGDLGDLPPGFAECMAQQGYVIRSEADIHSAPPGVLQACFGAAHQGGG